MTSRTMYIIDSIDVNMQYFKKMPPTGGSSVVRLSFMTSTILESRRDIRAIFISQKKQNATTTDISTY